MLHNNFKHFLSFLHIIGVGLCIHWHRWWVVISGFEWIQMHYIISMWRLWIWHLIWRLTHLHRSMWHGFNLQCHIVMLVDYVYNSWCCLSLWHHFCQWQIFPPQKCCLNIFCKVTLSCYNCFTIFHCYKNGLSIWLVWNCHRKVKNYQHGLCVVIKSVIWRQKFASFTWQIKTCLISNLLKDFSEWDDNCVSVLIRCNECSLFFVLKWKCMYT